MKLKAIPLMLVLLGCLTISSACSMFGGTDDQKVAVYLKAVGPDFEKSKEDLKVFDQQYTEDLEGVTKAVDLLKKSSGDFKARMDNAKKQEVPGTPKELKGFHDSLTLYYSDTIGLMGDLEKVMVYSQGLYKSLTPIEKVAGVDLGNAPSIEEVKAMVKTLKGSINESIAIVEKCTPPQYMADSHAGYVEVLKKYGNATDDFLYALQLSDPLRINATSYRYELLGGKLQKIGDEMSGDLKVQLDKMTEMGNNLEKTQDDLYKQLLIWEGQYKASN